MNPSSMLLAWRRQIDAGTRIGPRLLIAGPYLESASNAARQHATPVSEMVEPAERTRIGVATPADGDRIIAAIAARGVDHVKIRTTRTAIRIWRSAQPRRGAASR